MRFVNFCLFVLIEEAVICCLITFFMAILILSETLLCSSTNCAKNKYSGFVALLCKRRALNYFTGVNFVSLCAVKPNLPIGNKVVNASSSHCVSVINHTGCFFSPGATVCYKFHFLQTIGFHFFLQSKDT